MFKSYEAIYEHGRIKWTQDRPPVETARVISTARFNRREGQDFG